MVASQVGFRLEGRWRTLRVFVPSRIVDSALSGVFVEIDELCSKMHRLVLINDRSEETGGCVDSGPTAQFVSFDEDGGGNERNNRVHERNITGRTDLTTKLVEMPKPERVPARRVPGANCPHT